MGDLQHEKLFEAQAEEQETEINQQRMYQKMRALAASGCSPKGDWLRLFHTKDNPSLKKKLTELFSRLRAAQEVALITPAPHDRLEGVRSILEAEGLHGMILGHDDENLCEYVTPGGERLRWLTGFRGSAGFLLLLPNQAYLFVDGRYALQAPEEVDPHFVTVKPLSPEAIATQITEDNTDSAAWRIGIDPALFSAASYRRLAKQLHEIGVAACAFQNNPIDYLWQHRPPAPLSPIRRLSLEDAGKSTAQKLEELCQRLKQKKCDCMVVQAAEEILWLLNIRAWDVETAPLCLSKMIVHAEGSIDWFLRTEKLPLAEEISDWQGVFLHDERNFPAALEMLLQAGSRAWIDPHRVAAQTVLALEDKGAILYEAQSPLWLLAATMNEREREGAELAHIADGCALVDFMAQIAENPEPCQESDLVQRLGECRAKQRDFEQPSFHSIVAARGNSAQCHYRPIEGQDQRVRWGDIVLIDSGGHYRTGTTDVTRVIAYDQGNVPLSQEFRKHYTLVLQGLIAISLARFPVGTSGQELDSLARFPLWQQGMDYDHGTGHGVGSNSMVHFGPQRIAKKGGAEPLQEGMVLSLEPGVYFAHRYGIRLENLALVVRDDMKPGWLKFQNLTWVPFVRRMIIPEMLSVNECEWINNYHAEVYRRLAPQLPLAQAQWLARETEIL